LGGFFFGEVCVCVLTLELNVGTERCELVSDEGPLWGYVIVWKRTGRGEGRKVKRGQYWGV
jgi:hypothetical protein